MSAEALETLMIHMATLGRIPRLAAPPDQYQVSYIHPIGCTFYILAQDPWVVATFSVDKETLYARMREMQSIPLSLKSLILMAIRMRNQRYMWKYIQETTPQEAVPTPPPVPTEAPSSRLRRRRNLTELVEAARRSRAESTAALMDIEDIGRPSTSTTTTTRTQDIEEREQEVEETENERKEKAKAQTQNLIAQALDPDRSPPCVRFSSEQTPKGEAQDWEKPEARSPEFDDSWWMAFLNP